MSISYNHYHLKPLKLGYKMSQPLPKLSRDWCKSEYFDFISEIFPRKAVYKWGRFREEEKSLVTILAFLFLQKIILSNQQRLFTTVLRNCSVLGSLKDEGEGRCRRSANQKSCHQIENNLTCVPIISHCQPANSMWLEMLWNVLDSLLFDVNCVPSNILSPPDTKQ